MTKRWQFSSRTHRPCNPTRFCRSRKICCDPLRKLGRKHVHVVSLVSDVVFCKIDWSAVKRVGLNDIATNLQKTCVDLLYSVRSGNQQVFITPFKAESAEVIEG